MNKRVDHQGATHTTPIKLILSADYKEDYAIVLHCVDSTLYEAVDAAGVAEWELYVGNGELKGRKAQVSTDIDNVASDDKAVKMILNGQVCIRRGTKMYDLIGREL